LTWSLQMPFWKKVRVVFLLGLGGIAVAFSLYRLVIGIHETAFPHDTRIFMRSILTAYVSNLQFGPLTRPSNVFPETRKWD
jgi:hypothetical protein